MPAHFDPDILGVFHEHHNEFREIALKYADHDEENNYYSDGQVCFGFWQ